MRASALFYWSRESAPLLVKMAQTTREALTERIAEIAERVGKSEGIEVVETEFLGGGRQRLLRIYIDKPEGVTHGDCEISRTKSARSWTRRTWCPVRTTRWK